MTPTWSGVAEALDKAQDWPGLLAHCRRWTQAEPGNGFSWYGLGLAYGKLARYPEAIAAYRQAALLKPDFADAWNNLGVTYVKSGNSSAALEAVKELRRFSLQLFPQNQKAIRRLDPEADLLPPDMIHRERKNFSTLSWSREHGLRCLYRHREKLRGACHNPQPGRGEGPSLTGEPPC